MNKNRAYLDRYSLQARLYSGLVTVFPIFLIFLPLLEYKAVLTAIPAAILGGILFLMSNLTRSRGIRIENRLVKEWDGLPTTRLLRFRNSESNVLHERRRRKIETLYGQPLPTHAEEATNPEEADRIYEASIRSLITKLYRVRGNFPRVLDENINYGFRRNLLGLKPIGITLSLLALVADIFIGIKLNLVLESVIIGIVHLSVLLIWVIAIDEDWVREVADRYANRLLEAMDELDP